jgi:hypothetical protein
VSFQLKRVKAGVRHTTVEYRARKGIGIGGGGGGRGGDAATSVEVVAFVAIIVEVKKAASKAKVGSRSMTFGLERSSGDATTAVTGLAAVVVEPMKKNVQLHGDVDAFATGPRTVLVTGTRPTRSTKKVKTIKAMRKTSMVAFD